MRPGSAQIPGRPSGGRKARPDGIRSCPVVVTEAPAPRCQLVQPSRCSDPTGAAPANGAEPGAPLGRAQQTAVPGDTAQSPSRQMPGSLLLGSELWPPD